MVTPPLGIYAGLLALCGLSLFFSWALRRSSALMPLLAVCASMLFFTVAGVFGLLQAAGYVWYALCAVLLAATVVVNKKNTLGLLTPGLVYFFVGSAALIAVFLLTRPMLTHWDEFTFWGTAAKATGQSHLLYTVAPGNLIARSYPPGLIVYTYMMQFFVPGGFSEPTFIAAFAVLYLACFSAGVAVWGKNRAPALLLFAALFLLPLLFSPNRPAGQMQWAYQLCMADVPMALLFGGALCFYFSGGSKPAADSGNFGGLRSGSDRNRAGVSAAGGGSKPAPKANKPGGLLGGVNETGAPPASRDARLFLPLGVILAALVCVKDMGLALALIALLVVLCDMVFCARAHLGFFRLRRWTAILAVFACLLAAVAGFYFLWAWHLEAARGIDRFDLGSAGQPLGMVRMVVLGAQMLVGVGRTQQFSQVLGLMGRALFTQPVSLLGPGAAVFALILAVSALAFVLCATRRQRRRVLVFTLAMVFCFAAFYIFNIFTYSLIFKPAEALVLKDYLRYIAPFWMAWLMAALVLLARTAREDKASFYRLRVAQGVSNLVAVALIVCVGLLGNWRANFLRVSPSYYQARLSVQRVMDDALAQGMRPGDVVYIISQGDDGSRFYLFGYEMAATRALVFNGYLTDISGKLVLDEADKPQLVGNVAGTLIPPGSPYPPLYGVEATRSQLTAFLRQEGCTHLLVDVPDDYVIEEFGPLFADGLAGWDPADPLAQGHRYYSIRWDADGGVVLAPAGAGEGGGP